MSYFEIIKRYMLLKKKTSIGERNKIIKLIIKLIIIAAILFLITILVDKIDFPTPNKNIEKNISNENIKVIK